MMNPKTLRILVKHAGSDPYEANNPIPAALALSAVGGLAGLGGSFLSRSQRKNKLRNTLLGATTLPALFLAANEFGTDSIKKTLDDFSGRVFNGYDKYLSPALPGMVKDIIGSRTVNTDPVVLANAEEREDSKQRAIDEGQDPEQVERFMQEAFDPIANKVRDNIANLRKEREYALARGTQIVSPFFILSAAIDEIRRRRKKNK